MQAFGLLPLYCTKGRHFKKKSGGAKTFYSFAPLSPQKDKATFYRPTNGQSIWGLPARRRKAFFFLSPAI